MNVRPLSAALLFLLTACVQATSLPPRATTDEITDEVATQEDYLRSERAKGLVHGLYESNKPAGPRLVAVMHRLAPAAISLCRDLPFIQDPIRCAFDIHLQKTVSGNDVLNADADGKTINITTGMIRFTTSDDQLAMIVAHEMSHNIMNHIDAGKQNAMVGILAGALLDSVAASQGVNTGGTLGGVGGEGSVLAFSPAFEQEADYIGMYIMARAGYNYHNVPDFWRRMSLENPDAIWLKSTHPSNAERYVVMKKIIAEIDSKKRLHLPLVPEFKKQ